MLNTPYTYYEKIFHKSGLKLVDQTYFWLKKKIGMHTTVIGDALLYTEETV